VVANKPKMTRPTVYQFKLGDFTITNVLEGYIHREDMHPFTAKNVAAADVAAVAAEYRLPFPLLEHNFVPSMVDTGDKLIAFDPGFGEKKGAPTTGWFNELLPEAGYTLGDVDIVVVTHCHPDHIGNLMAGSQPTFPNAEIVFGRTEFDYWVKGENIPDFRPPTLEMFREVAEPMGERARFIEPGDDVVSGVTAVDTFGHSAGHMAFHIESNGQELMIMSDTVAHYAVSLSHPEWHFAMDDNPEVAAVSRRRLLDQIAAAKMAAVGFHMPFPSVGYIERRGDGFVWLPDSYQMNLAS
jgi:glyoxylase-like metal-dependent hydrolase (beta-lactamase superfamily II)